MQKSPARGLLRGVSPACCHGDEGDGGRGLRCDKQLQRRQWFLRISEPLGFNLAHSLLPFSLVGRVAQGTREDFPARGLAAPRLVLWSDGACPTVLHPQPVRQGKETQGKDPGERLRWDVGALPGLTHTNRGHKLMALHSVQVNENATVETSRYASCCSLCRLEWRI